MEWFSTITIAILIVYVIFNMIKRGGLQVTVGQLQETLDDYIHRYTELTVAKSKIDEAYKAAGEEWLNKASHYRKNINLLTDDWEKEKEKTVRLESDIVGYKDTITRQDTKVAELENRLSTKESILSNLDEDIDNYKSKIAELEAIIKQYGSPLSPASNFKLPIVPVDDSEEDVVTFDEGLTHVIKDDYCKEPGTGEIIPAWLLPDEKSEGKITVENNTKPTFPPKSITGKPKSQRNRPPRRDRKKISE